MEREIDLRPYVVALLRRWRLLGGLALAAALLAVAVTLMLPPGREASADLLVAPATSQVTVDPRFISRDATLITNGSFQRQALVDLASSAILETRVAQRLGLATYRPGDLLQQVEVGATSDLIRITVGGPTDEAAATLAEVWARSYEELVNELYSGADAQVTQLTTELESAEQRYNTAQLALEEFYGQGLLVQAEQRVLRLTGLLDGSRDAQQALYSQYLTRTQELDLILQDAQTLRAQVDGSSNDDLADALAALALRSRVAGGAELPLELRFDNPQALAQNGAASAVALDQLIAVLRRERERVGADAQQIGQTIASGDGSMVGLDAAGRARYEAELGTAQRELEHLRAQERLLGQRRDIALTSLELLERKSDEQQIAQASPQVSVRFVGASAVPPRSLLSRLLLNVGIAVVAATLLGTLFVLASELIRQFRRSGSVPPTLAGERAAEPQVASR